MSIDRDLICRLEFIRDYECKVDAEVNAINEALAELSKHTEEHTETHACDNKRTETHGVCLDAISRHAAIDAINHICPVDTQYDCTLLDRVDVRCVLSDLPSAEPEPHGRWINGKCNQCGEHAPYWPMASTYYRSNFCQTCGARMDGEAGMSELINKLDATTIPVMPKEYRKYQTMNLDDAYEQGWNDLQRCIEKLPSAKPEPHWIPVSERLPNGWKDVLVWFEYFRYGDYNRMYSTYGIGNYSNQYDSWLINHETGWKDLHVFAWMPMPEPWEGEKE